MAENKLADMSTEFAIRRMLISYINTAKENVK